MPSGLSMPLKKACAQSNLMFDLSWPTLPLPMLPTSAFIVSTPTRIGFLTRCASSWNISLMMSSFSPELRSASGGIFMMFGMRRTKVFVSTESGSSVVAPMIRTLACRLRRVSPRRLNVPVSMK